MKRAVVALGIIIGATAVLWIPWALANWGRTNPDPPWFTLPLGFIPVVALWYGLKTGQSAWMPSIPPKQTEIAKFVQKGFPLTVGHEAELSAVYNDYCGWCAKQRAGPVKSAEFSAYIADMSRILGLKIVERDGRTWLVRVPS